MSIHLLTNLTYLDLDCTENKITDYSLCRLTKLRHLDIAYSRQYTFNTISRLTNLQYINVKNTGIDIKLFKQMKKIKTIKS